MRNVIRASVALLLGVGIAGCEQASPVAQQAVLANISFKAGVKMDRPEFWRIIDFSKQQAAGDDMLQNELLIKALSQYAPDEIIAFECLLRQCLDEADDFNVMAAEKIIDGSVTDDSYVYFRCWLVAQGEAVFTNAVRNPDSLAQVDTEGMATDFEPLLYVATAAYKIKTGQQEEDSSFPRDKASERGLDYDFVSNTKGEDWTPEQLPARLPKLWAKYN